MVTFKVDAEARAKVKGTGKDGGLSIQVSGEGSTPLSAKISGDAQNPVAISPLAVTLSIVPEPLQETASALNISTLIGSLAKISEGLKVELANSGAPLSIALGRVPVDLNISVSSPSQEMIFKVDIKGTIGEK
jgi:hypothetical protein